MPGLVLKKVLTKHFGKTQAKGFEDLRQGWLNFRLQFDQKYRFSIKVKENTTISPDKGANFVQVRNHTYSASYLFYTFASRYASTFLESSKYSTSTLERAIFPP